jgi:hypothetical protein
MNVFSEGEVLVRDDLKYPDCALVVDGLDEEGCMLAHPLGGGFQLVVPPEDLSRFQRVEAAETIEVFSPGTFSIEGTDGKFEGWSDGSSWNGWARPCFTRDVAEGILEASRYRWSYDPSADEFTIVASEEDEPEQFKGEVIQLGDGGSVTAYFVGAGAWIWEKM